MHVAPAAFGAAGLFGGEERYPRGGLLLADSALAKRLGDNARQLVLERYTWDHCARRCLAAYSEMLAR